MLSQYLNIQQQQLSELVQQRDELNHRLTQAEQQQQQLQQYQQSLQMPVYGGNGIGIANNIAMRKQVVIMLDTVEQQIALSQSELVRLGQLLQQQLAKIKGIERLKAKRDLAQYNQQELTEQAQMDDLASQAHLFT